MAAKNTQNLNFLKKSLRDLVEIYLEASTLVALHLCHIWLCISLWFSCIYLKLFLKDLFTGEAIKHH
jgi:hypothetical protein